jgi:DHA1 family bicyclomycin/chloramphenicol resistance-like MFS transporter
MMATQAIAIDAMLPALPAIAAALGVDDPNHAQWVVTVYMAGLGTGQLTWGLLSDRFGRRPIVLAGLGLYVLAALVCGFTRSFEALLAWRFVHGFAAASCTVVRSIVRDLYAGRQMARVLSLTFVVFLTVPVLAPTLGQAILWMGTWRHIFFACGAFASIVWSCAAAKLPETLHSEYRLPLDPAHIMRALRLVIFNRVAMFYTLATTMLFGALIAYVGMVQQIFAYVFHRPRIMPLMFALCAAFMGLAAYTNSKIVGKLGMRSISHAAILLFIAIAVLHTAIALFGREAIWTFVLLQAAAMATFSLSVSNFGAMAMEPVGSVAGIGASLQGFVSTGGAAIVAALIGREFNGSTVPLAAGSLLSGIAALGFVLAAERGRLFRQQHAGTA